MKKPKRIFSCVVLTCPRYYLLQLFLLCFMFTPIVGFAQNTQASQWASAGGKMILSGNHNFTETWASYGGPTGTESKWWKGGFWDRENRSFAPWENTVRKSVAPNKGQFTVMGPCNVGLYQRAKGPRIYLNDHQTKAGFTAWTNTIAFSSQVWSGTVKEFNVNGEFWGYIPAGTEVTLDVTAIMGAYDNRNGTGEVSYTAPQDIEYEIWFFPRGEGCQIKDVKKVCANGDIIDVTNGDIPCPGENSKCEELKKSLAIFTEARKMTIQSIGDYQKQIDALNQHNPHNTGYLNEYQNNTLGNDPVWNKKNLQILQSGAGGGTASYLYNTEKWKNQLNKSIELQTLNLEKINWEISKLEEQLKQLGCN